MPFYDYKCRNEECRQVFEVSHSMFETKKPTCPFCEHRNAIKLISVGISGREAKPEIWTYNDINKVKPKWLKSRDGKTRVRYDSTKHGGRKGSG